MTYRPYTTASAFNKPIPASPPIHPDSAKMISAANHWLVTGSLGAWLGPRQRTYLYEGDLSKLTKVPVCVNFKDGHGYQCGAVVHQVPMPTGVAAAMKAGASYDRITWIVDKTTGNAWSGYRLTPPGVGSMGIACPTNRWNAVRMDFFPAIEVTGTGYGFTYGPSASHIVPGCGLIRPEDVVDLSPGSVIPHALRMDTFCGALDPVKGGHHPLFVHPAYGGDGKQTYGIPNGARVRLKRSIDVANWPSVKAKPEPFRSWLGKLGRTLQIYGIVNCDSTSAPGAGGIDCAWAVNFPTPPPWSVEGWSNPNSLPPDLMAHFEVVDWTKWTGG